MTTKRKLAVAGLALLSLVLAGGCRKRAPIPATPLLPKTEVPPPAPKAPTILEFLTEPSTIERGQHALLRWIVIDATEVTIRPELGVVADRGRERISPAESTTYTLLAKSAGGESTAATTIKVTLPPPPPTPPPPATSRSTLVERLTRDVHDIYFDFDKFNLRPDGITALSQNGAALRSILTDFPTATLVLEGHCDERGSAEYNIGLGDHRASAVKTYLSELGIPAERMLTISYGKERPQCTDSTEDCWQRNRRVHIVHGEDRP